MIDLRIKGLPQAILVDGNPFSIKTDFREWLKFGELIKESRPYSEYFYLFESDIPKTEFITSLLDFYINKNLTPQSQGGNDTKMLDWVEDGEYLVGSFLSEYGIDLIEAEYLHWHKFQALFRSLSENSKMMQIMGYRAYTKSNKSYEDGLRSQRDAWALPDLEQLEENRKLLEEFNKL